MKYVRLIFVTALAVCLCCISVFAYEVPDKHYYADVETQELGNIYIVFPNSARSVMATYQNTGIINSGSSSQLTAWCYDNSGRQYNIRFPWSDVPNYRPVSGTGYSYEDLHITAINSTNLHLLENSDFSFFSIDTNVAILIFSTLFILLVILLRKLR